MDGKNDVLKIQHYANKNDSSAIWVVDGQPFPKFANRDDWQDPMLRWVTREDFEANNLNAALTYDPELA